MKLTTMVFYLVLCFSFGDAKKILIGASLENQDFVSRFPSNDTYRTL